MTVINLDPSKQCVSQSEKYVVHDFERSDFKYLPKHHKQCDRK